MYRKWPYDKKEVSQKNYSFDTRNSSLERSLQAYLLSHNIILNPVKLFQNPQKVIFPHMINMGNTRSP